MTLEFSLVDAPIETIATDCLIIGVFENGDLPAAAESIDKASGGALRKRIDAGDITGKSGATHVLYDLAGIKAARVLVTGLGKADGFEAAHFKKAAAAAAKALVKLPVKQAASWLCALDVTGHDAAWRARTEALVADHAAYRWTATLGKRRDEADIKLQSLALAGGDAAESGLAQAVAMAEGVRFARDLGNMPPNICTPAWLAEQSTEFAAGHDGVDIDVLEREAMEQLGMHSLLAVARGSANSPRLIVLT